MKKNKNFKKSHLTHYGSGVYSNIAILQYYNDKTDEKTRIFNIQTIFSLHSFFCQSNK